jgi:hypothetical protein
MNQILKFIGYFLAVLFVGIVVLLALFYEGDVPLAELKPKYISDKSQFVPVLGMQVHVRDEGPKSDLSLIHISEPTRQP